MNNYKLQTSDFRLQIKKMSKEKYHRQIFNGITIFSGLLIIISWGRSKSNFFEFLIMFGLVGAFISFVYGIVLFIIKVRTKGEKRHYDTLMSSEIVSIIALIFYLIEVLALGFLGLLLFLGPGPGAMR